MGCSGLPSLSSGSQLYSSVTSIGIMQGGNSAGYYNSAGISITTSDGKVNGNNLAYTLSGNVLDASCNIGYAEVGTGGNCDNCGAVKGNHYYYCDKTVWKVSGSCVGYCNGATPVYDNANRKVANELFGLAYANHNDPSWTYKYCYIGNDNSKIYTLNKSGTGLGNIVRVGNVAHCGKTESDIKNYGGGSDRTLSCVVTAGINNNKSYWKSLKPSCSLAELKGNSKLQSVNVNIPYNEAFITITQAMSASYGGQERLINAWGITLTNNGSLNVTCSDTSWSVSEK